MSWYQAWKPYVPVAERRAQAAAYARKLAKKENRTLQPIEPTGRKITRTFWGEAWCDNLERASDFENRLPRGRTYVRNGSVIDLRIERGKVMALVSGSDVYQVTIDVDTLAAAAWKTIRGDCSQAITSLIDLLQGRLDQGIMERLTQARGGLLPQPREIEMHCTCPDWASVCKHVAAVFYGVGARLDASPELLFTLRGVDHLELISEATSATSLSGALAAPANAALANQDLGELFGIDLAAPADSDASRQPPAKKSSRRSSQVAGPVAPSRRGPKKAKAAAPGRAAATAKRKGKRAAKKKSNAKAPGKKATAARRSKK